MATRAMALPVRKYSGAAKQATVRGHGKLHGVDDPQIIVGILRLIDGGQLLPQLSRLLALIRDMERLGHRISHEVDIPHRVILIFQSAEHGCILSALEVEEQPNRQHCHADHQRRNIHRRQNPHYSASSLIP